MDNYSDVPIPPETPDYPMADSDQMLSSMTSNENSVDVDSDSLWQQQLVNTEQEILKEKENGKRSIEDLHSDEEPSSKKRANEYEKLKSKVDESPTDFQAWTVLLQHIDQVSDLESGREAYDSFFNRYPYCYGYWKKYADLEKRKGTEESTLKVFNRGLEAISLSVDLWVHYLEYVTSKYAEDEEYVRQQFENSIESCGLEFRSDKLWDLYISWESNGKRWSKVTAIYGRLLATPTCKYAQHWQKFQQEHIKKHPPNEVIDAEEYGSIRRTVLAQLNLLDADSPDEAPPGVESLPGEEPQLSTNGDEEIKLIRDHIIELRQKPYEAAVVESKARWSYEDAIKRPYFHVKPLEKSQLNAWRNYLEFEIKEGDEKRIKVLFERCLIACAFYEEFWMRYIRYLEEQGTEEEELRSVYSRACKIHLRDKLRPHLAWAAFEEEKGNSDYALEILRLVNQNMDLCLEAYMMSVAVERRRGNIDAAEEIYVNCLEKFKDEEHRNSYSSIAVKYARFLTFFRNDSEKAVNIIQQTYENDKSNFNLLIALADNALSCRPPKFEVAAEAFKSGTDCSYSPTVKLMFAHRYLHFVTECATENTSMNEALRLLRKIQQEVRQSQSENMEDVNNKGLEASQNYQKINKTPTMIHNTMQDKSSPSASVNGAVTTQQQANQSTTAAYQNYQTQGYGYNQYQQGYTGSQYPNWGYPNQQTTNYTGYNQQGWGGYPNYYGQR